LTGVARKSISSGLLLKSAAGEQYYTDAAGVIGGAGSVGVKVMARDTGVNTNLAAGEELKIISAIPQGIDSVGVASGGGILGGADAETDEEYLSRVLLTLRNPGRYGKAGDFVLWAIDSSTEVTSAWEFKNFGVFGTVMIQVINGSQIEGVSPHCQQVKKQGQQGLVPLLPPTVNKLRDRHSPEAVANRKREGVMGKNLF
jgi:uncharacterized phage protein gp47/JayE